MSYVEEMAQPASAVTFQPSRAAFLSPLDRIGVCCCPLLPWRGERRRRPLSASRRLAPKILRRRATARPSAVSTSAESARAPVTAKSESIVRRQQQQQLVGLDPPADMLDPRPERRSSLRRDVCRPGVPRRSSWSCRLRRRRRPREVRTRCGQQACWYSDFR